MALWTLVLAWFFREMYSTLDNDRAKVGYYRQGGNAHIYTMTRDGVEYGPLGRELVGELTQSLTPEMSLVYL